MQRPNLQCALISSNIIIFTYVHRVRQRIPSNDDCGLGAIISPIIVFYARQLSLLRRSVTLSQKKTNRFSTYSWRRKLESQVYLSGLSLMESFHTLIGVVPHIICTAQFIYIFMVTQFIFFIITRPMYGHLWNFLFIFLYFEYSFSFHEVYACNTVSRPWKVERFCGNKRRIIIYYYYLRFFVFRLSVQYLSSRAC